MGRPVCNQKIADYPKHKYWRLGWEEIEQIFGEELIWEELPDNKMSRIKTELLGVNIFDEGDWDRMISFLTSKLPSFEAAFRSHIDELKRILSLKNIIF